MNGILSGNRTSHRIEPGRSCSVGKKYKLVVQGYAVQSATGLEHVREFMIARKRGNFMLNKADFTGVASSYDEETQRSAA
jgi:hypothetical protein